MSGMLHQRINRAKCFLFDNRFENGLSYTNSTGSEKTLAQYTVMGRITSSNKLKPCVPGATDGSEVPRFILVEAVTVANGDTAIVAVCKAGDVDQDLLVWENNTSSPPEAYELTSEVEANGDTSLGIVKDVLFQNGINCKSVQELSEGDNGTPDYNS